MIRRLAVERSEVTVLASKVMAFLIGPVTVLAVGTFLDPTTQGYYYSFTSVTAASMFFEAGISTAIVQIAAHESGRLSVHLRGIEGGDRRAHARLSGVFRFAVGWYWAIAGVMAIGIFAAGFLLFSSRPAETTWMLPWLLLVLLAAADFALQPFFVMLEGTAQVVHVYRYRIVRTLVQNLVLIAAVAAGLGLYALPLGVLAAIVVGLINLVPARGFFAALRAIATKGEIRWRTEIFPFQWRIAVSWMAGYFSASLFTPILLATRGPAEAGQMGMTTMLTTACTALAASLMLAQAPVLGALAGSGQWEALQELFRRKAARSIVVAAGLLACACTAVWLAQTLGVPLGERVLSWWAYIPLALGVLGYHAEGVFAFFMRAQRREPYFVLEIVGAVLIVPGAILLAPVAGALGVAAVFAAVHLLVLTPIAALILWRSISAVRRTPPTTEYVDAGVRAAASPA